MSYYPTLREDIARAKEILAKGKADPDTISPYDRERSEPPVAGIGTIWGADVYVAYKLLESFVEVIETMDVKLCETALRARKRGQELTREEPGYTTAHLDRRSDDDWKAVRRVRELPDECVCRGCGHVASAHDTAGSCSVCGRQGCWR